MVVSALDANGSSTAEPQGSPDFLKGSAARSINPDGGAGLGGGALFPGLGGAGLGGGALLFFGGNSGAGLSDREVGAWMLENGSAPKGSVTEICYREKIKMKTLIVLELKWKSNWFICVVHTLRLLKDELLKAESKAEDFIPEASRGEVKLSFAKKLSLAKLSFLNGSSKIEIKRNDCEKLILPRD